MPSDKPSPLALTRQDAQALVASILSDELPDVIARVVRIAKTGTDKDALAAAKLILDRLAPAPSRTDPAGLAAAVGAGAVAMAGHLEAIAEKARARISEDARAIVASEATDVEDESDVSHTFSEAEKMTPASS